MKKNNKIKKHNNIMKTMPLSIYHSLEISDNKLITFIFFANVGE